MAKWKFQGSTREKLVRKRPKEGNSFGAM